MLWILIHTKNSSATRSVNKIIGTNSEGEGENVNIATSGGGDNYVLAE